MSQNLLIPKGSWRAFSVLPCKGAEHRVWGGTGKDRSCFSSGYPGDGLQQPAYPQHQNMDPFPPPMMAMQQDPAHHQVPVSSVCRSHSGWGCPSQAPFSRVIG